MQGRIKGTDELAITLTDDDGPHPLDDVEVRLPSHTYTADTHRAA